MTSRRNGERKSRWDRQHGGRHRVAPEVGVLLPQRVELVLEVSGHQTEVGQLTLDVYGRRAVVDVVATAAAAAAAGEVMSIERLRPARHRPTRMQLVRLVIRYDTIR